VKEVSRPLNRRCRSEGPVVAKLFPFISSRIGHLLDPMQSHQSRTHNLAASVFFGPRLLLDATAHLSEQ